jgi:phage terminase large subunit
LAWITVSAFDIPAYTGESVRADLLPLLVSPEWMEERKLCWGVDSPIYQSKVLGEFPDLSDDTLILPKWIEAAQKRTLERTRRPIIAADIARFGEDETVIMRREGGGSGSTAPTTRPTPWSQQAISPRPCGT